MSVGLVDALRNNDMIFVSNAPLTDYAKFLSIKSPGVLLNDVDPSGLPIKVDLAVPTNVSTPTFVAPPQRLDALLATARLL